MTQTLTNSSQLNYDTTANIPLADETDRGAVIKATDAEAKAALDTTKYITSSSFPVFASEGLLASSDALVWTGNSSYTKLKEIQIHRGWTYRVKFTLDGDTWSGTCYWQVWVNWIAVWAARQYNNIIQEWTEDFLVTPNDLIQIYWRDAWDTAVVSNFRIYWSLVDAPTVII